MQRDPKWGSGPITPEELEEVFGFTLLHEEAVLIERQAPKATIGDSSLIIPEHIRRDHQTGATTGFILQLGDLAAEELAALAAKRSRPAPKIGDRVNFSLYAPQPLGLHDEDGSPILPGFSQSPYAALEIIHWKDVKGYQPAERIKR